MKNIFKLLIIVLLINSINASDVTTHINAASRLNDAFKNNDGDYIESLNYKDTILENKYLFNAIKEKNLNLLKRLINDRLAYEKFSIFYGMLASVQAAFWNYPAPLDYAFDALKVLFSTDPRLLVFALTGKIIQKEDTKYKLIVSTVCRLMPALNAHEKPTTQDCTDLLSKMADEINKVLEPRSKL